MARTHFVAFFISFFCLQWTLSEEKSDFQIYAGKCEDMEHDVILNFTNVGFTKIGANLINSPRVSCLSLSDNGITEVSDRAFDLLPNLLYLDVSNNYIERDRLLCVGEGTNITTLVLDNNFNRDDVNRRYHYQDHYNRKVGQRKCSFGFPNLKHIYARSCRLNTYVPAYLYAPKLTHLYLSSNNINSLDFLNPLLSNVTHIYLDGNEIVGSKSRRFSKHVVHLDLRFNAITYLCYEYCNEVGISFADVTSLRFLSLAYNKISNIESDTFEDARNLTTLDLSNNTIAGFKKGTFDSLSSLQNLSLSHNNLKAVPEIYPLLNLKNLNLSFNKIEIISSMHIAENARLQSIDLSNNNISSIGDDTFTNFTSLVYLNLSQNKLIWLSQNWTTPLRNLKILHIGGIHFENLTSLHLNYAHMLTDVYLDDNAVTTLSATDMYNISPNLTLHYTKQYCDPRQICSAYCRSSHSTYHNY